MTKVYDIAIQVTGCEMGPAMGSRRLEAQGRDTGQGDAGAGRTVVTVVPEWLRLEDVNPFTGTPYAQSLFSDLPGYAQHVVTGVLDLTPWLWDRLVHAGEVPEVVACTTPHPVDGWLAWVAQRQARRAHPWECGDCCGTCVVFDREAAVTGRKDTPYLCGCVWAPTPTPWVAARLV